MRSPHSGLLAGVLGWGWLVQGKYGDAFGAIRGGHWRGFGGGCTACAGGVCVRGDWFPPVKSVADKSWCSPIVCRTFSWRGLVSLGMCAFRCGWCGWCGWCGCSVVGLGSLGCPLGSLCFMLCGRLCSACWRGLMNDETLSHYIFLFMLLLVPFLVIGLSIKANKYKVYISFYS